MKATDLIDDLNRRFADDDYGRRAPAALQRSSDGAVGSFQGLRLSTGVETLFAADGGISGHQAVTVVRGPHGRPLSAWVPMRMWMRPAARSSRIEATREGAFRPASR